MLRSEMKTRFGHFKTCYCWAVLDVFQMKCSFIPYPKRIFINAILIYSFIKRGALSKIIKYRNHKLKLTTKLMLNCNSVQTKVALYLVKSFSPLTPSFPHL